MTLMETSLKKDVEGVMLPEYSKFLKSHYEMNEKVLFVQLPQMILESFNPEIARRGGCYAFPPTGLQCLYEALKRRSLDIRILDLNLQLLKRTREEPTFDYNQWIGILEETLDSFDPYIVGISCMFDASIGPFTQTLETLQERNRSVVLTGGIIATYEYARLLDKKLCHFVVQREAENKINYLFDQITAKNFGQSPTDGICFQHKGTLYETGGERDVVHFDSDMIDSYSIVKIEDYYQNGSLNPFVRMADEPFAAIQMTRGCRAACRFCAVQSFMGKGVRTRSVDSVFKEIEYLVTRRGVRHFEWLDDDPLFYRQNFLDLLRWITEAKLDVTWSASNGLIARSLDAQMLEAMRDSGCIGFRIGIETGNAEMLKKIRKPGTLETFRRVSNVIKNYPEIFVVGLFMIGFPEEKFSQIMETFLFLIELQMDWSGVSTCQAIRGASMFEDYGEVFDEQMESKGATTHNYLPIRHSRKLEISVHKGTLKGLDVFRIRPDLVPDADQIKEIWFAFNLIGNYINNRNLTRQGDAEKFIAWVEMAQVPYPTNPYMSLFLALAYQIKGDVRRAEEYRSKAVEFSQTDYWRQRFADFKLVDILENFPQTAQETFDTIGLLREEIGQCYMEYQKSEGGQ